MSRLVIGLIGAMSICAFGADDQQEAEQKQKDSPETEATIQKREKLVREEIAQLKDADSWAGDYYQGDGLGANLKLVLAPHAGFVFEWLGCLGTYDRNYGAVVAQNHNIHLRCELPNHPEGPLAGIDPDLVPIRWGERHYLVPESKFTQFCNAYNSGDEPRTEPHGFFFLRDGDEAKPATGKPPLPDAYVSALLSNPLTTRVVSIGQTSTREGKYGGHWRSTSVVIDSGKSNGLYLGAELFLQEPDLVVSGRVTELHDKTATIIFDQDADSEADPLPKAGWTLSTKPPWRQDHQP